MADRPELEGLDPVFMQQSWESTPQRMCKAALARTNNKGPAQEALSLVQWSCYFTPGSALGATGFFWVNLAAASASLRLRSWLTRASSW